MSSKDFIGPPTWTVLHSYAAAYTPKQRKSFPVLVKILGKLFPCEICQENFKKKLEILSKKYSQIYKGDLLFLVFEK